MRAALADAHRRYSRRINFAHGWTGYLWQGRFASYPMDDAHLIAAIRYVEQNPVAAGLVPHAEQWRWSSARAHLHGIADGLTDLAALAGLHANWRAMLRYGVQAGSADHVAEGLIEAAMRTGRPLGDDRFVERLEASSGRALKKRKPGPKPRSAAERGSLSDAHGLLAFAEPQPAGVSSPDPLRRSASSR